MRVANWWRNRDERGADLLTGRQRIAGIAALAVALSGAGIVRSIQTMPVGTGETRVSPDGRFTASVMEWSSRGFWTDTPRQWFAYRVEGPGVRHELTGNPIAGPYFGSRSSHRVIRWSDDGAFVEFAFPDRTLRLTIGAAHPCRLTANLADYDVKRDANRILVRPLGWRDQRSVAEMELRVVPGSEALPDLDRRRRVGADEVRYAVSRQSGGSGGDDITMRAERALGAEILRFEWRGQVEGGSEPDFMKAWALIASAECAT